MYPNDQDSICEFFARVWIAEDDVDSVETWVHNLTSIDAMHRSADDWVREFLQCLDREWYADEFNLGPGSWQILFKGTLRGFWVYCYDYAVHEYDEDMTVESFELMELPSNWLETKSGVLSLDPEE